MKAIERLNGVDWKGQRILVSQSKLRRNGGIQKWDHVPWKNDGLTKKMAQKWVPVKQKVMNDGGGHDRKLESEPIGRKEIQVMNRLMEEWKGPGTIESRDVGPYRCLVTFSSVKTRDDAMSDELLLSVFDEVRPLWEFTWSLSRRIWVEIMDLPINMWCEENILNLTKLWGKMIMMDDRTEEAKSFSTARVLLDSFQWERIHEWVTIRIEGKALEVFVKEVGPEVYSVESHPNRGDVVSETWAESNSATASIDSPVVTETVQTVAAVENLNLSLGDDPLIEAIINGKLDYVHHLNKEREFGG
ncbi:hypothetical protein PIB30_016485 [Stylosanthes scabra]|uniref:DUF4283 domain-containing protein n=1 Tax=Stylosanthes scabra TaxID=79078 RepID=A0ABU6Y5N0_9FABA|nr:hypothetical protein [Stylosanthes scabra]